MLFRSYRSFKDFLNIGWLFGLFAFIVYFTYGYLEHSFWIFVFSFIVYALTLYLWRKIRMYLSLDPPGWSWSRRSSTI